MHLEIVEDEEDVRRIPTEGEEGSVNLQIMLNIFSRCIELYLDKNGLYGGSWRKRGWMGNLARILSKSDRLAAMLWQPFATQSSDEPVEDTALDMINLLAFFRINREDGNQWGH